MPDQAAVSGNPGPQEIKHSWNEESEWSITPSLSVAYVKRLAEVTDHASVKQREAEAILDFNKDGQLIGVEIIGGVHDAGR